MQSRMTGLAAMAEAASAAIATPSCEKASIFSADRFQTVRSWPLECMVLAKAEPMRPRPIAVISLMY